MLPSRLTSTFKAYIAVRKAHLAMPAWRETWVTRCEVKRLALGQFGQNGQCMSLRQDDRRACAILAYDAPRKSRYSASMLILLPGVQPHMNRICMLELENPQHEMRTCLTRSAL